MTAPKGTKEGIAFGREDIHNLQVSTITRHAADGAKTEGTVARQTVYHAAFDNPQWKQDYDRAWLLLQI